MGGEFGLPVKSPDAFDNVPVVELKSLTPDCNLTSVEFGTAGKSIHNLVKFVRSFVGESEFLLNLYNMRL